MINYISRGKSRLRMAGAAALSAVAAMSLWSCSDDTPAPVASGNQLTGILAEKQVDLTVNGYDLPTMMAITLPDGADGSLEAGSHSVDLTVGGLWLPSMGIDHNKGLLAFYPLLNQAVFESEGTLTPDGMDLEGVCTYGAVTFNLSGTVENPTEESTRKLSARVEADMSSFKAVGHTYELQFDTEWIRRSVVSLKGGPDPVIEVEGKNLNPGEALDWFMENAMTTLRATTGWDAARFTFNPDGSMDVEMRETSTGSYRAIDRVFGYLPSSEGYLYTYAPESFNEIFEDARDLTDDVFGYSSAWYTVKSPEWVTEASVYRLQGYTDSAMILSYLDGANALKLWGLLIQGVYPGNPGHVPVYTDQWRVLSWLRNLLMQGDIEINSDLIAVKVS